MRVLILGAGGPAGVNACRALSQEHEVIAADSNEAHLVWCAEFAETLLMPEPTAEAVNRVGADVVLAQPDPLVRWLSDYRLQIKPAVFLSRGITVMTCQDKLATAEAWKRIELRRDRPMVITEPWPDSLNFAKDRFGLPFWLRARQGAGAKGAIKVSDLREAYHWIRFWELRGQTSWVAQEHLPGRDFAWSSIWNAGELVTSFARERLEYLYPHLTPEGLTGTPTVARIVHDERVNRTASEAVFAIDPKPHGIMSVDLREDSRGVPHPTEINAGRGFTTFGLWSLYGPNFLDIAVQLAVGEGVSELPLYDALPEGLTLSRHIDCGHVFSRVPVTA